MLGFLVSPGLGIAKPHDLALCLEKLWWVCVCVCVCVCVEDVKVVYRTDWNKDKAFTCSGAEMLCYIWL